MVLLWCADIFNVAVEVWLAYWLFDVPKHRRFHQPWVRVLEYLGFLGIVGWNILQNRFLNMRFSNVLILFVIFYFFMSALIFTKRDIFSCLAWAGIYFNTIALLELPGIILSGWITGQPYLACIYQPLIYDYVYLIILSILMLIFLKRCGLFVREYLNSAITKKNVFLWLILAFIEWWVITYFLIIGDQKTGRDVFLYNVVSILCILFLIVGFAIFIVYRQSEYMRQEQEIQNARMETEYMKIKNEYQRKSREIHDLKHQLQALTAYFSVGQMDGAQAYLTDIINDFSLGQNIHAWTNNPLLDSLLSGKQEKANKMGVSLDIYSSKISTNLSDKDMSILLGNLLDNAIEAAEKVDKDKIVSVQILVKGDMLFIHIRNSTASSPVIRDGQFITSKPDKSNHGWGMKSIEAIVEKYEGQMDLIYDDNNFEVNITFWENSEVKIENE